MNAQFPNPEDTVASLIERMQFVGQKLADNLVLRNPLPWTEAEIISLSEGVYSAVEDHFDGVPEELRDHLTEAAHWAFCQRVVAIAEQGGAVVSGDRH